MKKHIIRQVSSLSETMNPDLVESGNPVNLCCHVLIWFFKARGTRCKAIKNPCLVKDRIRVISPFHSFFDA